jgi:hypothetical protein
VAEDTEHGCHLAGQTRRARRGEHKRRKEKSRQSRAVDNATTEQNTGYDSSTKHSKILTVGRGGAQPERRTGTAATSARPKSQLERAKRTERDETTHRRCRPQHDPHSGRQVREAAAKVRTAVEHDPPDGLPERPVPLLRPHQLQHLLGDQAPHGVGHENHRPVAHPGRHQPFQQVGAQLLQQVDRCTWSYSSSISHWLNFI